MLDSIFLADNGLNFKQQAKKNETVSEGYKVLVWRLRNNFSWDHYIRNDFWLSLGKRFPSSILPFGRVDAGCDLPMNDLASIDPVKVLFQAQCRSCKEVSGLFTYAYEEAVWIMNSSKSECLDLPGQIIASIKRQVKRQSVKLIKCTKEGCQDRCIPTEITLSNIAIPNFLFLFFPDNLNEMNDACTLDETISFQTTKQKFLLSALVYQPNHFLTINKLGSYFYNQNNVAQSEKTKSYQSFKEAYDGKLSANKSVSVLGKAKYITQFMVVRLW